MNSVRLQPMALGAVMVAILLLLQGCASTSRSETQPGATGTTTQPAPATPPRASALDIERQWLQSWFDGTPVRIAQQGADAVSIDVPLEFSFEAGRSKVEAPLAAVLDKLSESLRRRPKLQLQRIAAPGDASTHSPLAEQRAHQVRRQLLSKGVPAWQLGPPTVSTDKAVQLRIAVVAP